MEIAPFPGAGWTTKRNDNATGVDVRLLLRSRELLVAQLRFSANAGFDAHDAPWDCTILCLEGAGFVQVGEAHAKLEAGQSVVWPKLVLHRLWTEDQEMVVQSIEHLHQVAAPREAWRQHQAGN